MDENELSSQKATPEQTAGKAAEAIKHAATAAAKAGAGDVVGAAGEILKDETFRNAILGILVVIALIVVGCAMIIGTAITGVVQNLGENVEAEFEQQAIQSKGNSLYLYTDGLIKSGVGGYLDTIGQAIQNLLSNVFTDDHGNDTSNADLANGAYAHLGSSDYDTTLRSMLEEQSLTQSNGALAKRISMIKGRVSERGNQLKTFATTQYVLEGMATGIAEGLSDVLDNPFLFAGLDVENSGIDVQTSAFELTDYQALKIYAAYCIQHDCLISDVQMWDLMNYIGWYDIRFSDLETNTPDTIYDSRISGVFNQDLGGVVSKGDVLSEEVFPLSAPKVPYWTGTFAPQWYYEEIAQLKANNELYDRLEAEGNTEALANMVRYPTLPNGEIDVSRFTKLASYEPRGLIDLLFAATTAQLTISHTEYTGADEGLREALGQAYGQILQDWMDAYPPIIEETDAGNEYGWNIENWYYFRLPATLAGSTYYLVDSEGNYTDPIVSEEGEPIIFAELDPETEYTAYVAQGEEVTELDQFRTPLMETENEAYQLRLNLVVNYAAKSVEQLMTTTMGLWPGNLHDTEEWNGQIYAKGHAGNENLLYSWTDEFTDEYGVTHTIELERQQGYQQEAYRDIVLGLAETMDFELAPGLVGGVGTLPPMCDTTGWLCPVYFIRISSPFGMRVHPIYGDYRLHSGIDLGAYEETPIYAAKDGTVIVATYDSSAGNYVVIDHGDGFQSRYLHMCFYVATPGQEVKQGDLIGYVGQTGDATGPHLHFTVTYNGEYIDPMLVIDFEAALAKMQAEEAEGN